LIFISLLLVNCGGGGGGVSGVVCLVNCGGTEYTSEYNNQGGLTLIGAGSINDAGYTGKDVNVAVVDSGVDQWHPEFRDSNNNYVNLGVAVNYSGSSTNGWYDGFGHGTHVASIIAGEKDGSGIRGVAYEADIYSYKIFNDSGTNGLTTDSLWSSMVARHETDSIKVSNNSWGSGAYDTNDLTLAQIEADIPNTLDAYQSAVAAGTIFVWAAGNGTPGVNIGWTETTYNAGLPYRVSDIEDGWLAVVAVDLNKKEPIYSNRCGLAADWCVAAPGGGDDPDNDGIYAAKTNTSTYIRYSGTSMAAPHVSGIIATTIERFPALTAAEIRTRILTNASYTGLTDVNDNAASSLTTAQKEAIWGQGFVTSDSTLARIGSFVYSKTLNYYDDNNIDLSDGKISLPSSLSNNIYSQLANEDFVVFDSFDGAHYTIKGKELFKNNSTDQTVTKIGYNHKSLQGDEKPTETKLLYFNTEKSKKPLSILSYKEGPNLSLATSSLWGNKNDLLPNSKLIGDNLSSQMELNLFQNKFETNMTSFVQSNFGNESEINGYGFNIQNNISKKLSLVSSVGKFDTVNTNFSIFNDMPNRKLSTKISDFGMKYQANNNIQGFYRTSYAEIDDIESTNLSFGFEDVNLNSEVFGLEYNINNTNKFTLGYFQPSHINSGTLSLVTPTGRETDGTIKWTNQVINAKENNDRLLFFSSIFSIAKNTEMLLNFQQSSDSLDELGSGELILNYRF